MSFEECVKKTVTRLKTSEVQDIELLWEELALLEPFLPVGFQRLNQNAAMSCAYQSLLNTVLCSNALSEYGALANRTKCIDLIFLQALHVDSFFALVTFLKDAKPSNKLDSVLAILEKFFLNGSFQEMCKDQCYLSPEDVRGKSAWKPIWEQLITLIISLPNRIHNINIHHPFVTFQLQPFADIMSKSMYSTLEFVHAKLTESQSVSLEFQSLLLGRLFVSGYSDRIFKTIVPQLIPLLHMYLWQKVVQKLILGVPEKFMEPVIMTLLNHIAWFGHVEHFIGNGGIENNTIKYILVKKLILIRFFEDPDILFKLIGYYASNPNRQKVILTMVENLLDVWGKRSALKHQSESQHFYLSCGVMVCAAFLPSVDFASKKSVFMKYVLDGVQMHIENPAMSIRVQGMVVGQTLTSILDADGPKLSFEFEECKESTLLLSLLTVPKKPEVTTKRQSQINKERNSKKVDIKLPDSMQEEILDSDDDLEPYDQSNDTVFLKEKQPVYVQDVIDGLADHSRTNYSKLCLNSAEKIIRAQPHYTTDVSKELAKILLHLEDTFAADNFVSSRFRAMVAVTVVSPERVAKYFSQEFHNRNYNIRQRLDILEVLAAASQELSLSNTEKEASTISKSDAVIAGASSKQSHWNDIIQKRIEAKTKRYGRIRKEIPQPVSNKFGSVAGTFYFPLLKDYDNPQNGLDLLGENSFVLGRLIYTLGVICNSAANTLIFRQMAKAMLDFIWSLRYHVDVFVRQALLFSLCMIVANASVVTLTQDLQAEIYECQLWLQDILNNDPNKDCQACAGKILSLLFQRLKD